MSAANELTWLVGWYATKLHAVPAGVEVPTSEYQGIRTVCGAHVYCKPRTEWAAANLKRGVPRCKHCERLLSK